MSSLPRCPIGHDSATEDYCDVCGIPMTADEPVAPASPEPATEQRCDNCGAARDGRFCEECGHDAAKPVIRQTDAKADGWSVLIRADRSWFEEVRRRNGPDAKALEFPQDCPERQVILSGWRLTIGRRSRSRGIEPDIDLSRPPLDPGVSAQHAVLLARPGGWDLIDLDSTNGTTVGDATEPVLPNTPVALAHGDRIKLGAWTTITITRSPTPS
jgi:FHA domain